MEPFFTGSHKKWAEEMKAYSTHRLDLFTMPGRSWKWRMHGAAITLATRINQSQTSYDLIIVTDMMDLAVFKSLLSSNYRDTPIALYFHENQLTYPWSDRDPDAKVGRDKHYQFINYTSALCADRVFFNSKFHHSIFLSELEIYLSKFPDYQNLETVKEIGAKCEVLYLGLSLKKFDQFKVESGTDTLPLILWNHRWEHDKNPRDFFKALIDLKEHGFKFELAVLGEHFRKIPASFKKAKTLLKEEIVQWGYCSSFEEYANWLWKADIAPITSNQDFFGISAVEAIYCNTIPLVPNRLAFSEHINDPDLIYDSYDDLLMKIKHLIEFGYPHPSTKLRSIVKTYEWERCIHIYDQKWSEMAN